MNATSIPRNLYSITWQTMTLGPIQGWNTVRRAIFHEGRCCERARVIDGASPNWAAYKAANSPMRTDGGPIELAIDEDAALALRTDLERFLTQ
jgi:hypothetical protein